MSIAASPHPAETEPHAPPAAAGRGVGRVPERRCIVSGRVASREDMVRFVVDPGGRIVPDVEETLPGRGLWLTARRDIVETACAKKSFAKAAKRPVDTPAGLADEVERLLRRRCLDGLGLARRAGRLAVGFEAVRGWLQENRAAVVLTAADAAEGGAGKLRALATGLPVLDVFSSAELARALGREHAVHAALAPGRLTDTIMRETVRLAGFRRRPRGRMAQGKGKV